MGYGTNTGALGCRFLIRARRALVVLLAGCSLIAAYPAAATAATAHAGKHRHHRHHHRRHHHRHRARVSRVHGAHPAAGPTASATSTAPATSTPPAAPSPPPPAPAASCANADTAATSAPAGVVDTAVVCLVNQQRTSRGLPPLADNAELDTSAQNWTTWMVANDQFTHGSAFGDRISAVGYDWQTAGENIATGFATPRAVVTAWMASLDHCRNILDPAFRDVGTGVVAAPVAGYASDPSTWTQDFGLTMSDSPLSSDTGPQSGCPYSI